MKFTPIDPDYTLSPYTGMTRKHWLDAAKYLLEGVFKNISDYSSPIVLPRTENDITYPHKDATGNILKREQMAQIFEGLTRTLFIAAPLIKCDENTEICGFGLRRYYSEQILRSCTRGDSCFVGYYEDIQRLSDTSDDFVTFQQTVETCALVIGLDRTDLEQIHNGRKEQSRRASVKLCPQRYLPAELAVLQSAKHGVSSQRGLCDRQGYNDRACLGASGILRGRRLVS